MMSIKPFIGTLARTLAIVAATVLASSRTLADDPSPAVKTTTETIKHLDGKVEFKLVHLPAGKVTIKDKDGKDKEVEIKPFSIGQTEVTWDEYDVFYIALDLPLKDRPLDRTDRTGIRSRPSITYENRDRGWGHEGFPAGSMFCREAKAYCAWLSRMTNHKYRLPTEAEWEYACRAGGPPLKPDKQQLNEIAWYEDNADQQTHPVAKKQPNAWGLYDMLGNVAEWVTTLDGNEAVAGAAYNSEADEVHSAARAQFIPKWQKTDPQDPKGKSWLSDGGHVGFRVVRED
jgi:formylglycine-generating enzyme required for sulfatase activity